MFGTDYSESFGATNQDDVSHKPPVRGTIQPKSLMLRKWAPTLPISQLELTEFAWLHKLTQPLGGTTRAPVQNHLTPKPLILTLTPSRLQLQISAIASDAWNLPSLPKGSMYNIGDLTSIPNKLTEPVPRGEKSQATAEKNKTVSLSQTSG